jgi:hypothetical protein
MGVLPQYAAKVPQIHARLSLIESVRYAHATAILCLLSVLGQQIALMTLNWHDICFIRFIM